MIIAKEICDLISVPVSMHKDIMKGADEQMQQAIALLADDINAEFATLRKEMDEKIAELSARIDVEYT